MLWIVQQGVSCTSGTACTAVGHYTNSAGVQVTLAEIWNGSSWAIQSTPNPSGAKNPVLNAVSCTSSTACTAVGSYTNSAGTDSTLAERWNGTSWTIQSTPNATSAPGNSLNGVSCTSNSACTAVGQFLIAGTRFTLTEVWNGTGWAIQDTPNPSGNGGNYSTLQGVSCTSSSACIAVGYYVYSNGVNGTSDEPLAERWNGSSWTIQAAATPSGGTQSYFNGVSCASSSACAAVGQYRNSAGKEVTLAERWNGTGWAVQSTPNPNGAQDDFLSEVSCTASTACTAVGSYNTSAGGSATLAEGFNPSWSVKAPPNPTGAQASALQAVSCAADSSCTAAGFDRNSTGVPVTLAERWNGTGWRIQSTPNPTGAKESYLDGVSCPSTVACTAVGYDTDGGGIPVTLAEVWNGSSWTIQSTPNPAGATASVLNGGVSCTSSSACTAVGIYRNSSGATVTLAERWNGGSWTIQSTPNPSRAKASALNGVSCTTDSACSAAGYYTDTAGTIVTLAERWNAGWTIQSIPNPTDANDSALNEVSCTTASTCTAIGQYHNSVGVQVTLAEVWNGSSWAIQSTPNPSGAKASALNGLSCTTSITCTAAGSFTDSAGVQLTLAQDYS